MTPTDERVREIRRRTTTAAVLVVATYLVVTAADVGDGATDLRLAVVALAAVLAAGAVATTARRTHRTSTRRGGMVERLARPPAPPAATVPGDLRRVDTVVRGALASGSSRERLLRSEILPVAAALIGDDVPVDGSDPRPALQRLRARAVAPDDAAWDLMCRPAGGSHRDPGLTVADLTTILDEMERW